MIKRYFSPQKDITTYELAIIASHASGMKWDMTVDFTQEQWDTLPPTISRHYSEYPCDTLHPPVAKEQRN